jgi:ABC-type uncharacterized transport system substrate-binding protein
VNRRKLITLLGGAAAWPLAARAQQQSIPMAGFLHQSAPDELYSALIGAFARGLKKTGFMESRNVVIEYHWAENRYDRLPAMAADLVGRQPAVIVAAYLPAALAAKAATATIPIVFISGTDPVKSGLVASFNRPSGNITGVSLFTNFLVQKRLELLREVVPSASVIGVLMNLKNANAGAQMRDV